MNVIQLARAFAARKPGRCHNARVEIDEYGTAFYVLHRSRIAAFPEGGFPVGNWCGYYTPTTANHLNHIRLALGVVGRGSRLSYAWARDHEQGAFDLRALDAQEG